MNKTLSALLTAAVVAAIIIGRSWVYGVERRVLFWSGGALVLVAAVVGVVFHSKSGPIDSICWIAFVVGMLLNGFGARSAWGPFDPSRYK